MFEHPHSAAEFVLAPLRAHLFDKPLTIAIQARIPLIINYRHGYPRDYLNF